MTYLTYLLHYIEHACRAIYLTMVQSRVHDPLLNVVLAMNTCSCRVIKLACVIKRYV